MEASTRLPIGVRFGRCGMSALSPFSPQLRTLIGAAGTAEKCQEATYAVQQTCTALRSHFDPWLAVGAAR